MPHPHDHWAAYYDCVYKRTYGAIYDNLTTLSLDTIKKIIPKATIHDLGAGTGRLSIPLAKEGYQVTAVESSAPMCEIIRQKAKEQGLTLDVICDDIATYKHTKTDFAMTLFTVLSYALSEEGIRSVFENIKYHLNPNGYFFFDLPGEIFFNRTNILAKIEPNFKRVINLKATPVENIFSYQEQCSGTCCEGPDFAYKTDFEIRHWREDYILNLLNELGFTDTGTKYPALDQSGSTYHLFQLTK